MATPSSSQTTPSPSLSFIQPGTPVLSPPSALDPADSEERNRAVDKFLARARLSQLTHALRARLSYASYKAQHNLTHVPLPQLERQLAAQQPRRARHLATAPGSTPAPPASAGTKRRAVTAATTEAMPPPPVPSLYTSLLAPPPAKRARPSPTSSVGKTRGSPTRSPRSSKQASSASSAKKHEQPQQRFNPQQIINLIASTPTEREDMNAAATLTSLLLNSRNSPRAEGSGGLSRTSSAASAGSLGSFLSHQTPSTTSAPHRSSTPKPDDNDAAQFLLYLSTSPSPARPTVVREPGTLPSNHSHVGRILFPSSPATNSISASPIPGNAPSNAANTSKRTTPPTQLLPPPPSPSPRSATHVHESNGLSAGLPAHSGSRTPRPAFNLSDFVNVSPSPSAPSNNGTLKPSTLRSSVPGRRLFDDEGQVINGGASPDGLGFGMNTGLPLVGAQRRTRFADEVVSKGPGSAGPGTPTPLAAGIDLVRAASS